MDKQEFNSDTAADILLEKLGGKYGSQYAKKYLISALDGAHFAGMNEMRDYYQGKDVSQELLAALKECLRQRWSGERMRKRDPLLEQVKTAIATAEGQDA